MKSKVFVCLTVALFSQPWKAVGMQVDLYAHKDKFGQSLNMDISERECTNVARPWVNVTMSVDTHGSCMQFYDGKSCTGRIAVIQPFHTVHQMDLSLINFQNVIQSISPCGAKVPSGRYVIQSAVDASILTVSKLENTFAFVHTLPPRAFIPKSQQFEIREKAPTEYDVMPRIHETNSPVTYDAEAMKRGSFIRKVWKIESVGRGRYVFKSEWTGKCLYKTRFRTIEEHDCRAWSPNQEWILRPLLVPPKPTPPSTEINPEVKYQVPSRVVDQYLEQQKFLREQQDIGDGDRKYKIKNRRKRPTESPNMFQGRRQQVDPPKPQVLYSRQQPTFLRQEYTRYSQPPANLMYMEGMYPIYEEGKVEDPVFPDFLLHTIPKKPEGPSVEKNHDEEENNQEEPEEENDDPEDSETENDDDDAEDDDDDESGEEKNDDEYKAPKYAVTRRPLDIPLPTGHPNFVRQKPKYDGRIKDPQYRKKLQEQEEEEDEEEEIEEPEPKTEDQVHDALLKDKFERNKRESEESEEENADDAEESEEETFYEKVKKKKDKEASKENAENSEEDPAVTAMGFMKLLLKGVSNKISEDDRTKEEMINTFERR